MTNLRPRHGAGIQPLPQLRAGGSTSRTFPPQKLTFIKGFVALSVVLEEYVANCELEERAGCSSGVRAAAGYELVLKKSQRFTLLIGLSGCYRVNKVKLNDSLYFWGSSVCLLWELL